MLTKSCFVHYYYYFYSRFRHFGGECYPDISDWLRPPTGCWPPSPFGTQGLEVMTFLFVFSDLRSLGVGGPHQCLAVGCCLISSVPAAPFLSAHLHSSVLQLLLPPSLLSTIFLGCLLLAQSLFLCFCLLLPQPVSLWPTCICLGSLYISCFPQCFPYSYFLRSLFPCSPSLRVTVSPL